MKKAKQTEFPAMPNSNPHREILIARSALAQKIGSMASELAELDDQIRDAMRKEKVKVWRVEDEDGIPFLFTLKSTGERVVMSKIKSAKPESK